MSAEHVCHPKPTRGEFLILVEGIAPGDQFRCSGCERLIELGQPYAESPSGYTASGGTLYALTCVYCTAPEPCEGAVDYFNSLRPPT